MCLLLAARAGDGIRTREYLPGNRATLSSPAPLAFPWISAMTPSLIRRIKRLTSDRFARHACTYRPNSPVSCFLLVDRYLWHSPLPVRNLEDWRRSLAAQGTCTCYLIFSRKGRGDASTRSDRSRHRVNERDVCHGDSSREVVGVARSPFDLLRSLTTADCLIKLLSVGRRAGPIGPAQAVGPGLDPGTAPGYEFCYRRGGLSGQFHAPEAPRSQATLACLDDFDSKIREYDRPRSGECQ
jgi:hypothetical protein